VPEAWNVQSSSALQDADNLRCSDDTCGDVRGSDVTTLGYTLKSLLLGGQCFDEVSRSPPNGLQLTLKRVGASPQNDDSVDTLVMQNLGYFQLAAMPGAWELALAEGRGRDLFEIAPSDSSSGEEEHASKDEASSAVVSQAVAVSSFYDANTVLRVRKRAGKENSELLEKLNPDGSSASSDELASVDVSASGGLMAKASASIGNMFKSNGGSVSSVGKPGGNDTIHVFSLATGHLYERFLKIMMLSVVKRASMPVKFWLLENFLSPSFKDSADAMAREYGFEVGFVSYKWPSWLRQQTSKQRIIWGYKILFLDVLFPLNVSKVIYVDSDQTVRGDLAELWKLDIKGHPYAYTPFCSSRKETLGYQFWRSGYWKDHLRGKPYHISALYVVDLETFRRKAVGDSLRALYDQLSRDPNSLSNLDQDLPNYAQGMIPIFSLPQEWLWCESWCSDGTKAAAKTIDLCNNPMHKEPKLAMAKRVISGPLFPESWVELDEEIRGLEGRQRVGVLGEHASEEASLDMGFGK
jgi:UDP-glucose:glycoprotein glucosyltransferase